MRRLLNTKHTSLFALAACMAAVFLIAPGFITKAELVAPDTLRAIYDNPSARKIKILIVPGHDEQYWGTQFKDVKEATLTLELATDIYNLLKKDARLDVSITRDSGMYTNEFTQYFQNSQQAITSFNTASRQAYSTQLQSGQIKQIDGVPHNSANTDVAFRLFGINKWVNDNNVDFVLHVHFNDAPGRPANSPGKYRGFAIYIPERQYSNYAESNAFAQALFGQLGKYYSQSILPKEDAGIVEEQELIAIGPGNTLKAASALIEYGYIYEPQYLDPIVRSLVLDDLALQTSIGIHAFFGNDAKYKGKYATPLLPYTWSKNLDTNALFNTDVLHMQAALRYLGLFPVAGKEDYDCRMTGTFGPCTMAGLAAFQAKYKIPGGDGTTLGPKTRAKLNALFGK